MSEISNSRVDPYSVNHMPPAAQRGHRDTGPNLEQLDDMRRFNDIFRHMSEARPASGKTNHLGESAV